MYEIRYISVLTSEQRRHRLAFNPRFKKVISSLYLMIRVVLIAFPKFQSTYIVYMLTEILNKYINFHFNKL